MTTELMSSAFASFLGHRKATVKSVENHRNRINEDAFDKNILSIQFTESNNSNQLQESENPIHHDLDYIPINNQPHDAIRPPPMRQVSHSSPPKLCTLRTNKYEYYQDPKQSMHFSNSDKKLPLFLPHLEEKLDNKSQQYSIESTKPVLYNNIPLSKSEERSNRTCIDTQTACKGEFTSSSIFLPSLCDPSTSVNSNSLYKGEGNNFPENIFSCSQCKKTFSKEQELKKHKKSHVRPFKCRVQGCAASFSKANHLSRHIRIVHNKERPFACTVHGCGSRFGSKSHLGDHTRAVHMRIRTFKCDICNASWSKRFNLQKHIRIRHLGEKPFRCSICNMSFGTLSHVTRHKATVHKKEAA